ncbi:MAG: aminotransferase class V-fold PLP-dependent enzyme, partial [Steroidobacteraceae bacterium]
MATALVAPSGNFDAERVRHDFPILQQHVNGRALVYLDSAASGQRPLAVLRAVEHYETHTHANVHRGVHTLSQAATDAFEGARERARRFLNARSTREIVFVRGTTEGINLVAQSFGRARLGRGDEILISALEHHANIVPWQMVCEQTGCTLKVAPINRRGEIELDALLELLSSRTRLVAVAQVSNALGTVVPVERIVQAAHSCGALVLLDGAQAVAHAPIDVRALGCDFYAFSGHKLYGP